MRAGCRHQGATPALDWFLLTKRPQNIRDMLPTDWGEGWPNVWLGTTTENQEEAHRRIPDLVAIPAAARFLSVEPMLEPVDVAPWLGLPSHESRALISWIIVGGESGGGARPMHPDWVRGLRDQVRGAGAKLFVKQIGSNHALWPSVTGRAKIRHNGQPICGCRTSRNEALSAHRAAPCGVAQYLAAILQPSGAAADDRDSQLLMRGGEVHREAQAPETNELGPTARQRYEH